jgi:hypothetical protein
MKKLKNGYLCLMALFSITAFANYNEYSGGGGSGGFGGYSTNSDAANGGFNSNYQNLYGSTGTYGSNNTGSGGYTGSGNTSGGGGGATSPTTTTLTTYISYDYKFIWTYSTYSTTIVNPSYYTAFYNSLSIGQMYTNYYTNYYGGGGGGGSNNYTTTAFDKINYPNLDPCTKAVVDKLKKLKDGGLSDIITKLDGDLKNIKGINIIKIPNIAGESPTINASTGFDQNTPENIINISIRNNYITKTTELAMARTILHEIIHAYFDVVLVNHILDDDPELKSFPELWNNYVLKKTGSSEAAQHNQIANTFTTDLGRALQEYDTGIKLPLGAEPQKIYKDLAWGGLDKTKAFADLGIAEQKRLKNVILANQDNIVFFEDGVVYKPVSTHCK